MYSSLQVNKREINDFFTLIIHICYGPCVFLMSMLKCLFYWCLNKLVLLPEKMRENLFRLEQFMSKVITVTSSLKHELNVTKQMRLMQTKYHAFVFGSS